MKQPDLDAVLHCCYVMELCRAVDRGAVIGGHCQNGNDLGPILGELDWHAELVRIMEEWKMSREEFVADPNNRQVGGTHYKLGSFQHWDWVIDNRLSYLEGQVTKYVCRWRAKNGRQDLEKAAHYLAKLVWAYKNGKLAWPAPREVVNLEWLEQEYKLNITESAICLGMATYTSMEQLTEAEQLIQELMKGAL